MKSKLFKILAFLVAVSLVLVPAGTALAEVLYESWTSPDNDTGGVYATNWNMQSFTPSSSHQCNSVSLKMYRIGLPSDVTVSIRATSGGLPTGADLASGTLDGDTFTTDTAGQWVNFNFDTGVNLTASTTYAIVIRAIYGNYPGNYAVMRCDSTGSYSGGNRAYSVNSGSSWTAVSSDILFKEYSGIAPESELSVTTGSVTNQVSGNATLSGEITELDGPNVETRGFEWGSTVSTYTANVTESGNFTTGSYSLSAGPFLSGYTYYWRAMVYDGSSWSYGQQKAFNYNPIACSVVVQSAEKVSQTAFDVLSIVTSLGGGGDNYTIRGVQVSTVSGNYTGSANFTEGGSWSGVGLYGNYETSVTGLSAGVTYYYRAMVYDGYWGYSAEETYINTAEPDIDVTTHGYSSQTVAGQTVYTFSGTANSSSEFSIRGFQIGYAAGVWENTLELEELAIATGDGGGYWSNSQTGDQTAWTDNTTSGTFAITSDLLSANTTYYYRAYAGIFTQSQWWYFYGSTLNMTTLGGTAAGYPVVTTDNAFASTDYIVTLAGTLVSSASPVVERGFQFGTEADLGTYSYTSKLSSAFPFGYYMESIEAISIPGIADDPAGETIYYRAFARNLAGNTAYGDIESYLIPQAPTGPGGLVVSNGTVGILGNTATLRATVTNPDSRVITRYGFQWGITSACSDFSWSEAAAGTVTNFSHVVTGLNPSYTYFFRSGVLLSTGNWYWSTPTTFTTGETIPVYSGTRPTVTTLVASNIGSNFFTANGILASKGTVGATVSQLGFVYSGTNTGQLSDWESLVETGDFDLGTFDQVISLTTSGGTVYYAAVAVNEYGTSYGGVYYVNLTTAGGGSTTTGGNTPGTIPGFAGFLQDVMARVGMDNNMGHWAFMFLLMVLVIIPFSLGIFGSDNPFTRKLFTLLLLAVELVIVGAFLFSGLLGIWPVIILVFVAAGMAVIFGKSIMDRGRA